MKNKAYQFFQEKLKRIGEEQGNVYERMWVRPVVDVSKIKRVHLSGVCGKAMSSLAGLFVEAGYEVSGSDTGCYPPASDMISELGITFYEGYSSEHVKDKDLVIIANMFGPQNEEAAYVREKGIPYMSMSEAISTFFIKDSTSIVITGTHGKTTTTGLCAHVFLTAHRNPGFVVGGVAVPTLDGITETSFSAKHLKTKDRYFVIEGDEYDTAYFDKSPKFLHYKPNIAVVTSLEFDHADIYKDYAEYKQSFIFLAEELTKNDHLVLNGDSEEVRSLAQHTEAKVFYYGLQDKNDFVAKNIQVSSEGQFFSVFYKGQDMGHFKISLFGAYNIMNTLAVFASAYIAGLTIKEIRTGLSSFKGMKRRQEIIGKPKGITLIDDFAHHPTAVKETLSGIREHFPSQRIIAVFEPRSNTSRKKMFEEAYGSAFTTADALYLSMPALRHNDNPADFINGNNIVHQAINMATNKDFRAFCVENCDQVLDSLVPILKEGDVVVMMSNGSFDGIYEKIVHRLG